METDMTDSSANGTYRTSDLYYAAYLKVAGVPFLDTEREGQRVFFLFEDGDAAVMRDLRQQYFSGHAKVEALALVQEIKNMKSLTYME
jgi:hypothetical protein